MKRKPDINGTNHARRHASLPQVAVNVCQNIQRSRLTWPVLLFLEELLCFLTRGVWRQTQEFPYIKIFMNFLSSTAVLCSALFCIVNRSVCSCALATRRASSSLPSVPWTVATVKRHEASWCSSKDGVLSLAFKLENCQNEIVYEDATQRPVCRMPMGLALIASLIEDRGLLLSCLYGLKHPKCLHVAHVARKRRWRLISLDGNHTKATECNTEQCKKCCLFVVILGNSNLGDVVHSQGLEGRQVEDRIAYSC